MLLTMMATTGTMWGQTRSVTYEATTSIAVDDVVLLVAESSNYKKELSGFTTSGTIYGTVSDYTQTPNGVYPLTVVSGNSEGSFAFMNSDNKYLSCSSGNSLQLSETLNDNSSWTFNYAYTVTTITNVGTTARQIKYNSSSPRFACYTSGQQSIKLYKQVSSSLTDNDIALTGAPVALSFDLYNNSAAQTINYTTSSTGAVTIADNQYINTEIDEANKTITVTPVKVTPSAQTITVNQAADANYAAGSTIFTVNITNSAPYDQPTEIEALLNNDLFGTNYTGTVSGITDNNPIVGTKDNVTVTYAGSGNHYVNNSQIRFYPSNKLTFEAPSGYEIKQIVFTSAGTWAATISANGGTYNSSTKTWTGSATSVLFTGSGSSRCDMSKADIIIGAVSSLPTPTITIDATGITNTNVFDSTDAGSLSATVTYNDETVQGATVTWSGNNNAVATIDENSGAVTLVAAGSVTFTATFAGNESYNSATAQHVMTVTNDDPNAPGTVNNPYTVAAAMAATPTSGTSANVYIHGIVSAFYNTSIVGDGSNYRYYISDDGTTTSQLLVYKGKGLNNEAFSKADDLLIGDEIILFGGLTMYQNAPEVAANNYIVSLERPVQDVATPTFSPAAGTYASAQEVDISCETDGATIYYTLDGTEPTEASTPYNGALNIETTTTVKAIAYKNTANSYVATATYHICSAETPYTVAQALAFNEYPTSTIWVHGIVSTAPTTAPSSGQLKYYISDNGEATNELYIYNGKGLNNAAFTAQDDIQVGDIVTITGFVKDYQGTLEFDSGNYLTSFERPTVATPTFTPEEGEYTEAQSVTIACATEGAAIYYTLDGTEPTNASTLYEEEISVVSTTTIKAIGVKAGLANSEIATATYTITIAPTASIEIEPASLSVDADAHEKTFTVAYVSVDADLAEIRTCDEGGNDVSYDWFSATFASTTDHNNITCTIAANDGDARTAYFLVHVSGNVFSDIIAVSQEAYVVPPTPVTEGWVLTDLADLAEGDVFVIVGDNGSTYAMSNDNGTSSAPAAVEVTVSNYALSEEPAENLKWNLTIADGTYTFYPNGDTEKWLYCTNTNNGVRVGTNNNKTFTISNGYLFNSGTSRYVGIYNSQDWRCYTSITGSSNIKDQTFAFYKYVENPTAPKITLSSYSIEAPAEPVAPATEITGSLTVTLNNITIAELDQLGVDFCDEDGNILTGPNAKPSWFASTFELNNEEYKLNYTIESNTETTARVAYFKVYEIDSEVYSDKVTVTQEAYVAPTPVITVNPDLVEATFEETEGTLSITLENIIISQVEDHFEVYFCDEEGNIITENKPNWLIGEVQLENNVFSLYYLIEENTETVERTAYMKVYGLSDDGNTEAYSNKITFTQAGYVPPVVADNYELFSGELEEGDYIIYYDGYAMKNTISSNRLTYETVTPSENVISTNDATIVWHIASSGNYWTIYSADANAYAASTGTKNQAQMLGDGTDDKALWTVSGTSTYNFVNKYNTDNSVNAYLRNNGEYGFACYNSGTGGALSLYKKVDNTPSLSFNGTTANIGTYPTGAEIVWNNITVTQHNLTESISLSAKKGTVTPNSIDAGAEPTQVTWSYTPTEAGYTTDTITAISGTVQDTLIIQFMAKTPHSITIASGIEHGTVVSDKETAIENENVDFTVTPHEGYVIDEITVMAGETHVEFNDYDTFYRFQMPDSDVTISATFNALPKYTIKFYVNGNQDEALTISDIVEGNSTLLPTASTLTPAGFSIAGWAEEGSTIAVADPYTPTDNVDLYALFQLDNAQTTSGNFVKVTEELTDWSGEYLIAYSDNIFADGRIGGTGANGIGAQNVFVDLSSHISDNIISSSIGDSYKVTLEEISEGSKTYVLKTQDGKYNYQTSNSNGLLATENKETAASYPISVTFTSENDIKLCLGGNATGAVFRYNTSGYFRYYNNCGQNAVYLYKKTSEAAPAIVNVEYVSGTTEMTDNIPASTSYVVENGAVLTFTGTNEGTAANLVVQEGGQLIHTADVEATVQIGVSGYNSKSGDGWYLISSPVDNLPTSSVATGTYDLFAYDEATAYWWVDHAIQGQPAYHTFTTLERGKGYLYANAANVNLNYAGTMKATDANIKVDLSYACDEYPYLKGFNLVGNPFTRNITAADMVIGDTAVTSYYDFNADRTEFVTYQTNERPIQPGQGFFIQATASEQKLVFNPTTPPTKDASDFKYISISAGDENFTDKAYIQFGYGNTLRKMTFGENTMVYVMNDDDDYAAARVEELAGTMPVHFVPIEDGFYTITVETKNIENLNYMHLIDNIKNTEIDLLVEPSYTFKASESDNADRFHLVFDFNNYTGVNENYTNDNFAHQIGDEIFVSGEGTLQVFDVLGRFVTGYNVNGDKRISTAEFNTGVYIFRMVGTEVKTQKIIVR